MSSPNLSVCGLPFTEIASDVPASAVVSVIGTTCVQLPLLPGFSPMRSNCAVRYATVLSSPGLPGARPSKASDESTRTCSAKSPFARSGTNGWEDVVATAGAAAVALAAGACDDGARLQAASATTPAMHTIKLRTSGNAPSGEPPIGTPRILIRLAAEHAYRLPGAVSVLKGIAFAPVIEPTLAVVCT